MQHNKNRGKLDQKRKEDRHEKAGSGRSWDRCRFLKQALQHYLCKSIVDFVIGDGRSNLYKWRRGTPVTGQTGKLSGIGGSKVVCRLGRMPAAISVILTDALMTGSDAGVLRI